jgi:choline-sulfatase
VGRFFAFLREKGLYDRALVIVLSDHGESLGEHGEDEHGVFLYRSDLQVPLLVKLPKGPGGFAFAGASVETPVELIDVFTTVGRVLALRDFPAHPGTVSLVDLAAGAPAPERRLYAETFFPRVRFGWSDLFSLTDGRWHYIEAPRSEFYEMQKDPGETANLIEEKPGPFRSMKIEMEKQRASFAPPTAEDEEQKKKLQALGYRTRRTRSGSSTRSTRRCPTCGPGSRAAPSPSSRGSSTRTPG